MTGARTEPQFFVKVVPEGRTGERVDLSEKVLSFVYEDSEQKADKLVLSVDNWDLKNFDDPVWKKGNLLEVSWGYPGDMAPPRQVVIQKVTGFQVLSIEGHATSVLMNKLARCRIFENVRRSDVVRKLAQDNGYGPALQDIEDTEHILPVVTQARMTDAQLLRRLADREGFEFYVDFDGLHFHQRRLGQRPTRVLRWFTPPKVGEVLTRRGTTSSSRASSKPYSCSGRECSTHRRLGGRVNRAPQSATCALRSSEKTDDLKSVHYVITARVGSSA